MEQISIPLRSMYIFSISKSGFLTCFEFWVENVSRDIDNINIIAVQPVCDCHKLTIFSKKLLHLTNKCVIIYLVKGS